jgi:formiminotetrahydrofolate cyclodeaminase
MIQQPFDRIVASLAAKTPTPGGGAAAAMAGCMGAALFLMVVRYSRGKKANLDRDAELAAVEQQLDGQLQALLPMAERDCRSFDGVSVAFGMKKDTDAEKAARNAAIQQATVGAMVVPEETLAMCRDVFTTIHPVVGCIGKTIASDLAAGAQLLLAGAEGAYLNVRINAGSLDDKAFASKAMARADAVLADARKAQAAIAATVDALLR